MCLKLLLICMFYLTILIQLTKIILRIMLVRFLVKYVSLYSMRMTKVSHVLSLIVIQFLIKVTIKVVRIYLNACIGLQWLWLAIWCVGIIGVCWRQFNLQTVDWRLGRKPTKLFNLWTTQKVVVGSIMSIKLETIIIYRVFIRNC
jgi:hypothetical protein